jgi:polar amino acid transport system substrate-binding protein
MTSELLSKNKGFAFATWVKTIASAAVIFMATTSYANADVKTLEAGKLTIGINGDMPMTQSKDGQLSGTDGELMVFVAKQIGLEPKVVQMDWAALIEATKQGKVDVMHGAMGWLEARSKIMVLTEPIYYFGTMLAQKEENNFTTFADMKGRKVGTVTGFTLVPELKTVEGIGEVKLYDTSDGVMQDLIAGRIDIAIIDPPLVQYGIYQHPEWKLKQLPLTSEMDRYPVMSAKYNIIFGVNKNEPELAEAMNAAIKQVWADCLNVKAMAKYGLGDKAWFVPPEVNSRNGVDRPEDYKAPNADHCF